MGKLYINLQLGSLFAILFENFTQFGPQESFRLAKIM